MPDGLMHRAEGSETAFRGDDIQDVVVSDEHAFVFIGDTPYRGISIARQTVVDGDFDEFVSQLQQHWQDWQKLKTQAS